MKLPIISRPSRASGGSAQNRSGPTLPLWLRVAAKLSGCLPLLVFFFFAGRYLFQVYTLIQGHLTPIVAAAASQSLHREVRIKQLDLLPLGVVTLEGVSISDGPSFAHKTKALASAKRVVINYNALQLLFDTSNVAHSIGDVTVDHPVVRVTRTPENNFNFSDIFNSPSNVNHKPFLGTLHIIDGAIIFKDHLAPATTSGRSPLPNAPPALNQIGNVSGTVDFSSERHVIFTADGDGAGAVRHFSSVSVHGGASRLHARQFAIFVHVTNGDLAYWSTYFKNFPQFTVTGGLGDADIQVVKTGPKSRLDLSGDVAYHDTSVTFATTKILSTPVIGMAGIAHFNDASVQTQGTFTLNNQRIAASGILYQFGAPGPYIDFTATALNANVNSLVQAIPPIKLPDGLTPTVASGQVSFIGQLRSPTIDGDITSPSLAFMEHEAINVSAHIHYYNKVFAISRATCQFPNGGIGAANLISDANVSPALVKADGAVRGYDLADLLQTGLVADTANLTGRADFDFVADNQTGTMILRSNVRSSNFSMRGISGLQGAGRITWPNGEEIHVDRFVASGRQGTLAASGAVPVKSAGQKWRLALDASGIDLNLAMKPFVDSNVQGLASFHGMLSGPSGAPDVVGRVQVFGARYGRYSFDSVAGKFNYNGNKLSMSNVLVRRYPTQATITGVVADLKSPTPTIHAAVHFARADLEDFKNIVEQYNAAGPANSVKLSHHVEAQVQAALSTLTGTAQGDVQIAGPIDDPHLLGEAVVTEATIGAYRVDRARANFKYEDGRLVITRGLVSIEDPIYIANDGQATSPVDVSNITASGSYTVKSGQISATFAGSDFDLSKFRIITRPYADVGGSVDFSGSVSGTFAIPTVAVGVVAHSLIVNHQYFDDFSAFATYDDGIVSLTGDPWVFVVSPSPDRTKPTTTYRIDSFRLVLPTSGNPKRPIFLSINADIPRDSPETVKHFMNVIRAASLVNKPFVQSLIAEYNRIPQPFNGQISADAIKVYGNLDALNVATTAHIANLTVGRSTVLSADLMLSPESLAHATDASLSAQHVNLAGIALDNLAAQGVISGNRIALSSLRGTSSEAYIQAQGYADLNGSIDGTLDASGIPLSIFNTYLPRTRALTGELSSLTVSASGLTKRPNFTASITIDKPAITVRDDDELLAKADQNVPAGAPQSARQSKSHSWFHSHKASKVVAAKPEDAGQTYSLDRIRSGSITLRSAGNTNDRILSVTNLSAYKGGRAVAVLSGSVPLRWTGGPALELNAPDSEPISAQLTVQDLGAIAALSPGIDPTKTGGSLTATFGRDPAGSSNVLVGHVVLANASVGFTGVSTSLSKIVGQATFDASHFTIDQFTANSSVDGTLQLIGGGTIGASPSVELTLIATKFGINENGSQTLLAKLFGTSVKGKVNGSVKISGAPFAPTISTPKTAPVVISDLSGTIPSPVQTTETPPPLYPFDPSFDVAVQIADKSSPAKMTNALLTAYIDGDAQIGGRLSAPTIAATLRIYKGNVLIPPSTRMNFVQRNPGLFPQAYPLDDPNSDGEIILNYPTTVLDAAGNPQIELRQKIFLFAQATVNVRRSTLASYQSIGLGTTIGVGEQPLQEPVAESASLDVPVKYTINAYIYGTVDPADPKSINFSLVSNPGDLNQTQIMAALGGYSGLLGPNGIEDFGGNLLAGVLLPGILTPIENSVENFLGLSDFSFDYSTNASPSVTLVRPLGRKFSLTYSQTFGEPGTTGLANSTNVLPLYSWKLSYSITNQVQLSYSTDNLNDDILELEGVRVF